MNPLEHFFACWAAILRPWVVSRRQDEPEIALLKLRRRESTDA